MFRECWASGDEAQQGQGEGGSEVGRPGGGEVHVVVVVGSRVAYLGDVGTTRRARWSWSAPARLLPRGVRHPRGPSRMFAFNTSEDKHAGRGCRAR